MCLKEFPHLVQMQQKYSGQGLAAISVSLDPADEKESREKALKFLTRQKATFTNLLLDEPQEVWEKKLQIAGPPVVYVYGRDGKLVKKFDEGVNYAEVEKVVLPALKK